MREGGDPAVVVSGGVYGGVMSEIVYVRGDATVPSVKGVKVIAHVCNDIGGWGKGFVLARVSCCLANNLLVPQVYAIKKAQCHANSATGLSDFA